MVGDSMIAKTHSTKSNAASFSVGDKVMFRIGPIKVRAVVVEDRGRIGANGRRLFRVQRNVKIGDPVVYEFPEQELSHA